MNLEEKILHLISLNKKITTKNIVAEFKVSRQFASSIINKLVKKRLLIKFGSTRYSFYVTPEYVHNIDEKIKKRLINKNLQEHEVLQSIERQSPLLNFFNDNIRSIFDYAFSEMLNNAIEHSCSKNIDIEIVRQNDLIFHIKDGGMGVFNSIMKKRKLNSELEAIQDLLKGKTTTKPKTHSGEGIFFTSKISDIFSLESSHHRLTIDNLRRDIFVEEIKSKKRGTKVTFQISLNSKKHLNDIFYEYYTDPEEMAFDKTEIQVKLYTMGTIHVSRSQAKRILAGLEKFKLIILDFDKVPNIGQAFADEIFRVFKIKHPEIKIQPVNMSKTVEFMIKRAITTKR